jgi:hypothetical protein
MAEDRRVMYDRFSEKGDHSIEWVPIIKDFLNQAFAGGHHAGKFPFKICQNYKFLTQDEVQLHLCKKWFRPKCLVWHDHGEVEPPAIGAESDRNEDKNWMDDMITNIGSEYEDKDLESRHHRWRCRISIDSLLPQIRKCMMAPMWPYCRWWHV